MRMFDYYDIGYADAINGLPADPAYADYDSYWDGHDDGRLNRNRPIDLDRGRTTDYDDE